MKKVICILFSVLCINVANAQETNKTFAKGDNVIGLGFGIGGVYGFSNYDVQTPVFGAQYDRGIVEFGFGGVLGVGGFFGYKSYASKYDLPNGKDVKDRYNIVIIGARGTMHYDLFKVENLDTYGGVMIAFHAVNQKTDVPDGFPDYDSNHNSAAYASIYAGAKYYFTPKFGAFAEVGYGVSWLTMGVAFKF
jgi:hypothetical protein